MDDMTELYVRALANAPAGSFYFVAHGEASFGSITAEIGRALDLGESQPWGIESAIAEWGHEPAVYALGSNSRVRTTYATEQLHWQPRHDSILQWIRDELTAE